MAKKEFKHKLSEAVEKMSYDVLPEAKPEDFEVTTVAAVSEPFADARVRNKAARERFKKMIDAQTKQAKEVLELDKHLPERQVNGNGRLVEAIGDAKNVDESFKKVRWHAQDLINEELTKELQDLSLYDRHAYTATTNLLYKHLGEIFEEAAIGYKSVYESKYGRLDEGKVKISLDESLFTPLNEDVNVENSKKTLTEADIITDAREYKPWVGAVPTYEKIEEAGKLDEFYALLDEAYPQGIDKQALNDLLWFDADWVYEMLGMEVEE